MSVQGFGLPGGVEMKLRWESLNGRQRTVWSMLYPAWMGGRKHGRREFDFDDQEDNREAAILLHTAARELFFRMFLQWNLGS